MQTYTSKIPQITLTFWIMKILATTLGETGADHLTKTMKLGYALGSNILIVFFFVTLTGQLLARRYHPFLYWAVIVATSTAGTAMSDYMDRTLKLGYAGGSLILSTILVAVLTTWYLMEGTLQVQNIRTRRVEILYWVAILFSNTLGTALGDFLADDSGLGFAGGAAVIGAALAVVALLYYFTKVSHVVLFWVAFVLTRPFGATMGDVLVRGKEEHGFDFGTGGASAVLGGVLVLFIVYETWRLRREDERAPVSEVSAG